MERSGIDWARLRDASEVAAAALADLGVSELTPSRRDFLQFAGNGRREVAVIGTIRRRDPYTGVVRALADLPALAAALDEAEVAAIGVSTEPLHYGGSLDDLRAAAAAVSAPVLRDDFAIARGQIYESRGCGADAIVLPIPWLDDHEIADLTHTASDLHMAVLLCAFNTADLARALPFDKTAVAVWGLRADGSIDHALLRSAADAVPARRTVVMLGDVRSAEDFGSLEGLVDAAIVASPFHDAADVAGALERLGART